MLRNFKEETLEVLQKNYKTWNDVKFIQGNDFRISNNKDELLNLMDFEYGNECYAPVIAQDLVIVGDTWWLERREDDSCEWWEFKEKPKPNKKVRKIKRFKVNPDQIWKINLYEVNND